MAVVTFDPATFKSRYPEFDLVSDLLLSQYFNEAGLYLDNTDASACTDTATRAALLNMLVAHIATLNGSGSGKVAQVGRVASASEGGVSASFESIPASTGTQAWYMQTQYGASFWAASKPFRSFLYVEAPIVSNGLYWR